MRSSLHLIFLGLSLGVAQGAVSNQEPDRAAQQAAGIVAGLDQGGAGQLMINEKTGRLEVRNGAGTLVEEIAPGTAGCAVDVSGQEYRLSFGKDDMGRRSVLVRAGPAMRKPIMVEVFGRKAVISPEASLLATLAPGHQVFYEPSLCGQVYYIENTAGVGSQISRLAAPNREVAVLAKPSSPTGAGPGAVAGGQEDAKSMEKAGEAVKSVFCAVFGLPDKEPATKAKVYRLRGASGSQEVRANGPAPMGSSEKSDSRN